MYNDIVFDAKKLLNESMLRTVKEYTYKDIRIPETILRIGSVV